MDREDSSSINQQQQPKAVVKSLFTLSRKFWTDLQVASIDELEEPIVSDSDEDLSSPSDDTSSESERENGATEVEVHKRDEGEVEEENEVEGEGEGERERKIEVVESEGYSCRTCDARFATKEEQSTHYRSDHHTFNLQRKLVGMPPILSAKFDELLRHDQSLLAERRFLTRSEEGHKSREEKRQIQRQLVLKERMRSGNTAKITLNTEDGTSISLWRNILLVPSPATNEQNSEDAASKVSPQQIIEAVNNLYANRRWAVLLCSGGNFAGVIFDGNTVLARKSFHRYTVRKKQGGSQATADARGSAHKSAGAYMRRYHAAQLQREIRETLEEWKPLLDKTQLVFLFTPGDNNKIIFYEGGPLGDSRGKKSAASSLRDDGTSRFRAIPFPVGRKPNFTEAQRVHKALSSICIEALGDIPPNEAEWAKLAGAGMSKKQKRKAREQQQKEKPPQEEKKVEKVEKVEETVVEVEDEETRKARLFNMRVNEIIRKGNLEDLVRLYTTPGAADKIYAESTTEPTKGEPEEVVEQPVQPEQPQQQQQQTGQRKRRRNKGGNNQQQQQDNNSNTQLEDQENARLTPLYLACKLDNQDAVNFLLRHPETAATLNAQNEAQYHETALHAAAREGRAKLVSILLEHSADPTLKTFAGKTAYDLGQHPEVRNAIRRFAGAHTTKWDWTSMNVVPLTSTMEDESKKKLAERKKRKKESLKKRKQEDALKQQEEETKRKDEEDLQAIVRRKREAERARARMSDREKRAYAAEMRMKEPSKDCEWCGKLLGANVIPFKRLEYQYCTLACVNEHKKTLDALKL